MPKRFLEAVRERVVFYDGAFGTYMQGKDLGPDDFGGPALEGCNEMLVLTRPDLVAEMHDSFFAVGVDVVETATFGAFAVPLDEYGLADRTHEINVAAARIAKRGRVGLSGTVGVRLDRARHQDADARPHPVRRAARRLRGAGARPRSRAASTCCSSRRSTTSSAPRPAIIACRRAMAAVGREVPIQVQVTMENTGRMLVGTEIGAALTALAAMQPDVIGLNCATGPREMSEHLRHLTTHSKLPISCLPNAGLPSVVDGKMHYDLTPDELADFHARFITELRRLGGRRVLRHVARAPTRRGRGGART